MVMRMDKIFNDGQKVTVLKVGGWKNDFSGVVCGSPETIETVDGDEFCYFIKFDEPQHDLSNDGPYKKAQILDRFIEVYVEH